MIALPVLALRQCGIWIFFAGELEARVSAVHNDPERAALPVPSPRGERRGGVVKHSHSTRDREARAVTFTVSVPLVKHGVRRLCVRPFGSDSCQSPHTSQSKLHDQYFARKSCSAQHVFLTVYEA